MWLAGHGWEKDGEAGLPVGPTGTLGVVAGGVAGVSDWPLWRR
jgi:hypothetical protein